MDAGGRARRGRARLGPVNQAILAAVVPAPEQGNDLPFPAWVFGIIAFAVLLALLVVLLNFDRDR